WRSINRVTRAAEVPLFGDAMWRGAGPMSGAPGPADESSRANKSVPPNYNGEWTGAGYEMKHFCIDRHGAGSINWVFIDGSLKKIGVKQLWTLRWHRRSNINGPYTKAGGVTNDKWPEWMRPFKDF
ncbi:MAG: hypothetical protein JSU94_07680, partial [Phycisphaerales bacterium]